MRVVITGAGGQLGQDLVAAFLDAGSHHEISGFGHDRLDVGNRDAVLQVIGTVRPDVVVHAGAWTAVDACEADPDRAYRVNALGSRHVAEAARLTGAHVVYISTDYVFDGMSDRPYREWDDPNPLSVYGRSKLAGEKEVLAGVPRVAVVRTSWVFSTHGANMLKTVLRLSAERPELAFVDDQRGCPTYVGHLADATREVLEQPFGVYHVAAAGECTWAEFAEAIFEEAGLPVRVQRITTAELGARAPRPAYSVLRSEKGAPELPHWREGLRQCLDRLPSA